jgi:acetyl-CoA carboxylase carboxyltransferase component
VPVVSVVLRRGYGLGAQAMMVGGTRAPVLTVAWPAAELGPMGVEGAVRLGMRKELAAVEDEQERSRLFDDLVAAQHARGRALPVAAAYEIDDVIDPARTRQTVLQVLQAAGEPAPRTGRKRVIDTW